MRRIYLIGLILLMTIVLVIGGGLMYLNGSLGSDQMLALVNRTVLHTAGLELRWREASGSFLFNLTVEEPVLMMADGDTLLRADRMKLGIRPWSIVRGGIELTRVEADRPVIDVLALSADTPEERSARRSARRERRDRQAVEAGADTTAGQEEKPLHIRNVVIRRGTVTFARSGPVRAASGLLFRGDLRIGKEIGIAIDIRRLRGVLDDWGLMIEDLDGGLTIAEDYLRFTDTRVRTRSTRLTMAGDLDLRQERGAGDLAFDLTTRGLQEYWPITGGEWPGNGPLAVRGRLRRLPWEPDLSLSGDGSIAGIELIDFSLESAVRPDRITAVLRGRATGADSVSARVSFDPRSGAGLMTATLDSIRLGETPAGIPLRARRVELQATVDGFDPLHDGGEIEALLAGVMLDGFAADTLRFDSEAGAGGLTTRRPLEIAGPGYSLQAEGGVDFDRGAVTLSFTGASTASSALLIGAGIPLDAGDIEVEARLTGALRNPSVRGGITCTNLHQGGLDIQSARMHFNIAQVLGDRIGTFGAELDSLHSGDDITIDGAMLDGRIVGERVVLQLVSGWWAEGEASLHGNIAVTGDSIRARVDAGRFIHRDIDVVHLAGDFSLNPHTGAGPFSLTTRFTQGEAAVRGQRNADHALTFTLDLLNFDAAPIVRSVQPDTLAIGGRIGGRLQGRIGQHVETLSARAVIVEPRFETEEYERLELDASYAAGRVEVNRLVLSGIARGEETGGYLESSGSLTVPDGDDEDDAPGRLDLEVLTTDVRLEAFERYLGGMTVSGDFSSRLRIGGTFAEPLVRGEIGIRQARIDTFEIASLETRLALDSGLLRVENGNFSSLDFTADFQGTMPLELSLSPFAARIDTGSAVTASLHGQGSTEVLIQPLRDQIESFTGDLSLQVELTGSLADPRLDGSVQISDGELRAVALGQAVEDLQVALSLSESRIVIDTFTGRLPPNRRYRKKPGDFALTGSIVLGGAGGGTRYDLALAGEALGLSEPTGSIFADLDAELRFLTSTTAAHPVLEGQVELRQGMADVGMILDLVGAGGSSAPAEERTRPSGFEMNVEVGIPGRLTIVGGELGQDVDVELVGDLILRKNPQGSPYLLGTLEAVPGRGQLFAINRRWTVDEATVTFGTIEEINPDLNARFLTDVEDIRVILALTGNVREPLIEWSTEGDVLTSEWDIYQLLALGAIGVGQQAGGARRVVGNFIENAVSRSASALPFVDTIETEGVFNRLTGGSLEEDAQVSVGKYIGSSLYLRYSRSIGGTTLWDEWRTEYRISRRFRLSGTYDRYGRLILELKWRIEY